MNVTRNPYSPATLVVAPQGSRSRADFYTDGVNDQVQIQAAIDAVTTTGGTVLIKQGTYTIQAAIIIKDNVRLTGEGYGTILAGQGTTDFPIIERIASSGTPSRNWEISNMKIDGTNVVLAVYTTSAKGIFTQYSVNCRIVNVWVYNTVATGIGTDFMVRCFIDSCLVENCGRQLGAGGGPNVGGNGIGIGTGGFTEETLVISNCHAKDIGNNGIMFEQQNNTTQSKYMHVVNSTAQGCLYGFRNAGCKNVTYENCSAVKNTNDGMLVDIGPIGGSPEADAMVIAGCNFSENLGSGIRIAGTGNTRRMLIANNIINNNTNNGILSNCGTRFVLTGNMIYSNGKSGIRFSSASVNINNINVTANTVHNNGTSNTAGDKDGIQLANSSSGQATDFIIATNRVFDNQGGQTQDYGISVAGTHTRTLIEGNHLSGNKTGPITLGTSSVTCVIQNNLGHNPQGAASISVGGSPYTYTAGNTPESVHIRGGTVSDISKNSTTLYTDTGHSVELMPNESVVVTYSSGPTMVKDRH